MLFIITAAYVDEKSNLELAPFYFSTDKEIKVHDFMDKFPDVIETIGWFLEENNIQAELIIYPCPEFISVNDYGLFGSNGARIELVKASNFPIQQTFPEAINGKIEGIEKNS